MVFLCGGIIANPIEASLLAQTFVAPGDTGSIEYPIENDATSDKPVDVAELDLYPTPPAHFIVKGTSIRGPDTIPPAAVKSFVIDYEIAADAPEGSFTVGLKPKAETANVTPPWADLYTQVIAPIADPYFSVGRKKLIFCGFAAKAHPKPGLYDIHNRKTQTLSVTTGHGLAGVPA